MSAGLLVTAAAAVVLAYLLFPVLVVVAISFSSASFLQFPPPGFSLQWHELLATSPDWLHAFWLTLQAGAGTAALSVLLGVPMAMALARHRVAGQPALEALLLATLLVPSVIKGLALYLWYVPIGLQDTMPGLILAHAVTGVPYVVLNALAALKAFDPELERAAVAHGATPLQATLRVTLPLIAPGIAIGAIFAFLQSAQELLVTIFVYGTVDKPLAVKLWEGVRIELKPTIAAASTWLVALALLGFAASVLIERRARVRAA